MKNRCLAIVVFLLLTAVLMVGCNAGTDSLSGADKNVNDDVNENVSEDISGDAGEALKPNVLVWGSAGLGSRGYICIEAFCSIINKNTDLKSASIATAGATENLALIDQEEIHLGQCTSSDLFNAYEGLSPFEKKIEFTQLFAYGKTTLSLLTLMDSDIQTIDDLKGKKVHFGPANSASVFILRDLLSVYGIQDEVQPVYGGWDEAAEALRYGHVVASVCWFSSGYSATTAFTQLALTDKFRTVGIDSDKLKTLSEQNLGILEGTTLAKSFEFFTEDSIAPGNSSVLIAAPELDDEIVYNIVKTLYENAEAVRAIDQQSLADFTLDNALGCLIPAYPVHPGAARYFQEIGLWNENYVMYER